MTNVHLKSWVDEMARLTQPDAIHWCDGSDEEKAILTKQAVEMRVLEPLDQAKLPGCYLHRSNANDVARVEHLTFICSKRKEDAGPTNNWMAPDEAYAKLRALFEGSMKGRTMYVVPYLMGPVGSPFSKVGIELTDSIYVALNMAIMTRMGFEHTATMKQHIFGEDYLLYEHAFTKTVPGYDRGTTGGLKNRIIRKIRLALGR